MKPIRRHKEYEKHFLKRITPHEKLVTQFKERLVLFVTGKLGNPLNDYALKGKLAGKRGFSVAGDIRVVYKETEDNIVFLDVGTHNQVYK
ncbi:MAG TPA: type II toxin-antitoxin system mRNA interferase toxin, RelE/StbE family [Candidatus Saccharimonadales bacterium]|nr:type II toxin-antitoxin system mRNA interferase toxin, RelE/StbE family [Candidatus Saccharimonadales bacterium]